MVPPPLTSVDVDSWALAFATCVTVVSVALAGLSVAHVAQWDRAIDEDEHGWVIAFAERAKKQVETACPRLKTKVAKTPPNNCHSDSQQTSLRKGASSSSTCFSSPARRR